MYLTYFKVQVLFKICHFFGEPSNNLIQGPPLALSRAGSCYHMTFISALESWFHLFLKIIITHFSIRVKIFLIKNLCYLPPTPLHMESTVQLQIACVQLLPHVPSLITLEYLPHCCGSSISIESFLFCFQSWLQNLLVLFIFGLEKREFNHHLKPPSPIFY